MTRWLNDSISKVASRVASRSALFGADGAQPRAVIAESNAAIRQHLAARAGLEQALEEARARVARAREQLDLAGPALERAREAKDADAADRERRAREGTFDSDPALVEALEHAERAVREAERTEDAARAALPSLEAQVRDAEEAIARGAEAIDSLVWRRRMAELALEFPEVQAAAQTVMRFKERIAALADVSLRHRLYSVPSGGIPEEFVKVGETYTSEKDRRRLIDAEVAYLRRLRSDPNVQLGD